MNRSHLCLLSMAFVISLPAAEEKQARVTNGVKEAELTTVTLNVSAEKHLAIQTVPIVEKSVPLTRLYGGELVLTDRSGEEGQSVFSLLPQMSPADRLGLAEAQITADGQLDAARVEVDSAQIVLTRAEKLWAEKVGSLRTVDDAKATLALATSAMSAARAKRDLLGPPVLASRAPETLWIKVPVYVGDLDLIKIDQPAVVGRLDGRIGASTREVLPVTAPPSADPVASTVDLFYEIENLDRALRPGQRVGITLALSSAAEALVAPYAAILYDLNGGTWVYESLGDQVYTLRRVQIARVVAGEAVLTMGPQPGAKVVTDGAAELFGTEFGVGK